MTRNGLAVLGVAVLVVLAGCAGAPLSPGADGTPTSTDDSSDGTTDGTTDGTAAGPGNDGAAASSGTINFYVSDERNAIGDFEHLDVTITSVGFHLADGDDDDDEADDSDESDDGDDGDDGDANQTVAGTSTAADGGTTTETANGTTTADDVTSTADEDDADATTTDADDADEDDADDDDADDDDEKRAGWVEHDVENRTVDLTQYQGANATLLSQFDVPDGTYDKVFVHVGEIDGTLNATGESVNVKLPSEKLHVNSEFDVGANGSTDFVFDATVFKAGNSGKYILKPVVSESGTDVPIEAEDRPRGDDGEDADDHDDADDSDEADDDEADDADDRDDTDDDRLRAALTGDVRAGETVTLQVEDVDGPVANATVEANGETVGETGENGTLDLAVPTDAEELEIAVTHDDREAENERQIAADDGDGGGVDGQEQ